MSTRKTLSITIAVGALALAGCGSSSSSSSSSSTPAAAPAATTAAPAAAAPAAAAANAVTIKDFKFGPDAATVKVGDKITWTNQDSAPHTATASGGFDTGTLTQGKSKTITFTKAGTFPYVCTFHPYMKGTITVTA